MNIQVKVIPQARKTLIKEENGLFKVYLTQPALEGRANEALIATLAEHFGVRRSEIRIIKGLKSRLKTISINGVLPRNNSSS